MSNGQSSTAPPILLFVVDGETYTHNERSWEVCTNRHTQTDGQRWGWIEGPARTLYWSGEHGRAHAGRVVAAHAEWLSAQEPIGVKVARLYPLVERARRAVSDHAAVLARVTTEHEALRAQLDGALAQARKEVPA